MTGAAFWTTVNATEALPGTVTPLTWSFFDEPLEVGLRLGFHELGVLTRAETRMPASGGERFVDVFHGKVALNMDTFRAAADRIPGTSGDALESQMFGSSRPEVTSRRVVRRYPVIAARLPRSAVLGARMVRRSRDSTGRMWRAAVSDPPTELAQAVALMHAARRALRHNFHWHGVGTFLAQGCYDRLARLCAAHRLAGLEMSLLTGFKQLEEAGMVNDVRAVARGTLPVQRFLAEHGFHGPGSAELAIPSWRADPAPLLRLVERHRDALAPSRDTDHRADAVSALLATTRGRSRLAARLLLRLGLHLMPLREVGRAGVLLCTDTARIAAEIIERELLSSGRLEAPGDLWYLTLDELRRPGTDLRERAGRGRQTYEADRRLSLPETWYGRPIPREAPPPAADDGDTLKGIAGSAGRVLGVARVITDPHREDLEPGEILVCQTTDPSWASTFALATGIVVGVGSALSHGAILARELGIPCVINVAGATARVRTGDTVRVDGSAGTVHIVERAHPGATGQRATADRT